MRHPVDAPLSPLYRKGYDEKQRQEREAGEVYYDRLTHCEPSAYPRWLVEPYHKEFSPGVNQSWLMQEYMNETRRVYTDGRPHDTPEGHTWLGDSIGFWDAQARRLVDGRRPPLPARVSGQPSFGVSRSGSERRNGPRPIASSAGDDVRRRRRGLASSRQGRYVSGFAIGTAP
jgi:hypothetical protein